MSQRRASHHNRCPECRINKHFCVCEHLAQLKTSTNVSLIVHVSELKLTSNTAQFVEKLLPEQSQIFIRGRVHENFSPTELLQRPGRALFLFPDENSQELNQKFLDKYPGPYHLIVPDGNWTQAKKVKKREELFDNIPTVRLPAGPVGEYRLRKAPRPEWVSTFEAVAHALGVLDGSAVRDSMLNFFRKWVEATLAARSGDFSHVQGKQD
jgi:DTW domain-containing protein YfiP